jgi:hypothetical protein
MEIKNCSTCGRQHDCRNSSANYPCHIVDGYQAWIPNEENFEPTEEELELLKSLRIRKSKTENTITEYKKRVGADPCCLRAAEDFLAGRKDSCLCWQDRW